MSNLYVLSNEYQRLLDVPEYDSQSLAQLDSLQDNIKQKAVAVAGFILNLQAEYEAVTQAQKSMYDRARRLQLKIDVLTDYLKENLIACKIDKITDSPHYVITIKTNPPSVHITDKNRIPLAFFDIEQVQKLSLKRVQQAIKDGENVEGAKLVQKTRLEIK